MKFSNTWRKNIALIVLAFSLVVSAGYSPLIPASVPKTHAQQVVYDPANHIVNTLTSGATVGSTLILQTLNGLAWTAAKLTIQTMTKSIVTWINRGYQGSPAFVTDLNSTFQAAANATADSFIKQLASNVSIKSPFQNQIANALGKQFNKSSNGGFFVANAFTLNQTSSDPAAFLKGDFSKGGFNAWFSALSHPQNNPYGAAILAGNALGAQVANTVVTKKTELDWSKGFLPWRGNCAAAPASTGNNGNSAPTAPTAKPATSLSTTDKCASHPIQTPGAVVETQLENTLGSPIRQLELANSINEIIGAAVTQMVTHVLGSTGLTGLSQPSSGSGGSSGSSILDTATSPAAYAANTASIAQGFTQNLTNQQTQINQYQKNWQTIQSAAQTAQAALQTSLCPNAQVTLTNTVQPVLTRAAAALVTANSATTAIAKVQADTAAAMNTDAASQPAAIQAVSTEYQTFLASAQIPSAMDISDSTIESSDSGTATPASLYTQMTQATAAAHLCILGH